MVEIITGVATMYALAQHAGNPLFCGGLYADTTAPWVALPYRAYMDSWTCGEPVYLEGVDATGQKWSLAATVRDTGPFGAHCVVRGNRCIPIVVDVPEPHARFKGLSSAVTVRMMAREAERMGMVQ